MFDECARARALLLTMGPRLQLEDTTARPMPDDMNQTKIDQSLKRGATYHSSHNSCASSDVHSTAQAATAALLVAITIMS